MSSLNAVAGPLSDARPWLELTELLGRCERLLRSEVQGASAARGLSEAQCSLLWACSQAPVGGVSQSELSQALTLSAAHVSGQVEQLRGKGLLAGQRSAPDRRRQVWQLTDAGHAQLDELLSELLAWAEQLDRRLSPERRQTLAGLLCHLAGCLAGDEAATSPRLYHPQENAPAARAGGLS